LQDRNQSREKFRIRYNKIADISEKFIIIQKAQTGFMTLSYHIIVVIAPTIIEVLISFIVSTSRLGVKALPLFVLWGGAFRH